ncbi:MAG: flagellar filament capping protein FliD [Deltaproteobacteria bacterium]|jgi:flagellar hook-associated protein 2|nr:flagellar filament capping protein FliD [Deltaproteobacteria bacterium]
MAGEISFGGLVTGIDTEAIISATIEARRASLITPLTKKVDFNEQQNAALNELNTKILNLFNSLKSKTTNFGGTIEKKVINNNSDIANISANSTTPVMSAEFKVTQLATPGKILFTNRFPDTNSPLFPSLTGESQITISVGTGANQQDFNITVDNTTTLAQLNNTIYSTTNGAVSGTIINTGTSSAPNYAFGLSSRENGTEKGSLSLSLAPELETTGVLDHDSTDTSLQAKDAKLVLSGIGEITRSSNTITDLFPGVTIELKQKSENLVQFSTAADSDSAKETIQSIVDQINEIITLSQDNNTITSVTNSKGTTSLVYSALAKTRLDEQTITSIKSSLSAVTSGVNSNSVRILADIGITTNRDGTLAFDTAVFDKVFNESPTDTFSIMQNLIDDLGNTGSVLNEYSKFSGVILTNINSTNESNKTTLERIERLEQMLAEQETNLRLMFANLESITSKMQSTQSTLTSVFNSLTSSSNN